MSLLSKTFIYSTITFTLVYLLRGFGILSFMPGGIILLLLLIAFSTGLMWGIIATLRY
jgi:hypothetical protein